MRPPPSIIVAFDFGQRRIGVASGNTVSRSATPAGIVEVAGDEPRWDAIGALLRDLQPQLAVVGLPYNVDGSESAMTAAARAFAAQVGSRYGLPVSLVDERYSSREAGEQLKAARASGMRRRRVARADIDAAAACVILDRWFDEETRRDALTTR